MIKSKRGVLWGKNISNAQKLYSSNNELRKMRDELNSKKQNMTPISELEKRKKGYSEIWEGDENFINAMVRIFDREKGYVNNRHDLGGETNLGTTEGMHDDFKKKYPEFEHVNIGIKDKDLAYVHFDATVNHGLGNSRKFLEQSGGDFDKYIEIRRKFYKRLTKDSSQNDFYKGWMNRLDEIQKNRGNLF